ncbi:hypothetical protein C8R46DRAFT_1089371 [Mycena filopes]|nr:hypothetical protein C8R46DRAFT_1089371 [Mycena filopes]
MFTLCLLPLLHLPLSYAATKILDVSDSSLVFSPGWSQESSVLSTDSFGGSLTASLPDSASSVTYVGFNTAGGSMYGYTIDCDTDCVLQTVNAKPAALFSIDLDPTTQHILKVFNIPSDADDGSSQINFDHLNVSVQDNAGVVQVPISSTVTTASASASSTSSTSSPSSNTVKVSPSSARRGATSGSVAAITSSVTGLSPSSSASVDDHPSTAANPVLPVASSAPSSAASSSGGRVSRSVIVAATVLSIVFAGCFVATLVVFLRQRRQKRNNYASSQSGSLSPTGSIIPIMAPPQMRTASLNPFSDPTNPPPGERGLDSPSNSSLMQRRMEGRSISPSSPGAPPSIPLPDVPLDRRPKMESRSNSPAIPFARNDLWIARTPVKSHFSAV